MLSTWCQDGLGMRPKTWIDFRSIYTPYYYYIIPVYRGRYNTIYTSANDMVLKWEVSERKEKWFNMYYVHISMITYCYNVNGVERACFWTVALNFLRNLQSSLFPIVLTTEGGAQPPGFTAWGNQEHINRGPMVYFLISFTALASQVFFFGEASPQPHSRLNLAHAYWSLKETILHA